MKKIVFALASLIAVAGVVPLGSRVGAQAPATQTAAKAERTTWYFYRVKWGFQRRVRRPVLE